jgi:hypothetical protein
MGTPKKEKNYVRRDAKTVGYLGFSLASMSSLTRSYEPRRGAAAAAAGSDSWCFTQVYSTDPRRMIAIDDARPLQRNVPYEYTHDKQGKKRGRQRTS